MDFLADESCDFAVVRKLREAGHEVVALAETYPSAPDSQVIRLAASQHRLLLTEDKDFGALVHAHGTATGGVILLRYPRALRERIADVVVRLVHERGDGLLGRFVVVEPHRIRVSPPVRE